nr:MAG TPA: hypothetical protein [Caudoviricetes sp.]
MRWNREHLFVINRDFLQFLLLTQVCQNTESILWYFLGSLTHSNVLTLVLPRSNKNRALEGKFLDVLILRIYSNNKVDFVVIIDYIKKERRWKVCDCNHGT